MQFQATLVVTPHGVSVYHTNGVLHDFKANRAPEPIWGVVHVV